ncbi:hypothetical protein QBC45DRAFT_414055 [Copromyces sp. CBS 386.78]|nr:hypothetical protein QBC45DRAFT_414055 [Copromyces sp. CBS 386.78]
MDRVCTVLMVVTTRYLCVTFVPIAVYLSPQVTMCIVHPNRVVRIKNGIPCQEDQGLQRSSWASGYIRSSS